MCDGARTALAVLEAALNEEVLVLEDSSMRIAMRFIVETASTG